MEFEGGRRQSSEPTNRNRILPVDISRKVIADEKGTTVSKLALAWTLAKYPELSSLIGTTSVEHLKDSIDALSMTLTDDDIARIEIAFPDGAAKGVSMRNMRFVDGKVIIQKES